MEPSAGGIVNVPPLILVPAEAVVSVSTWQVTQPTLLNSVRPFCADALLATCASRGGALLARMKRAKRSISKRPSDPGLSLGSETVLQRLGASFGCRRLVLYIPLRYPLPEHLSRSESWAFQPKRPTSTSSEAYK